MELDDRAETIKVSRINTHFSLFNLLESGWFYVSLQDSGGALMDWIILNSVLLFYHLNHIKDTTSVTRAACVTEWQNVWEMICVVNQCRWATAFHEFCWSSVSLWMISIKWLEWWGGGGGVGAGSACTLLQTHSALQTQLILQPETKPLQQLQLPPEGFLKVEDVFY